MVLACSPDDLFEYRTVYFGCVRASVRACVYGVWTCYARDVLTLPKFLAVDLKLSPPPCPDQHPASDPDTSGAVQLVVGAKQPSLLRSSRLTDLVR